VSPASEHYQSLDEFDYYSKHPEIPFLIRFLGSNPQKMKDVSWEGFQDIARAYLLDQGMAVADISRIRSSGGDFLCLDANGKVIVVEVKHYNHRSVDIGAVWKIIGVITTEGLDGGMVITSHRLSADATTLIERGHVGKITNKGERRDMKFVGRELLVKWLLDVQERDKKLMLEGIEDYLDFQWSVEGNWV
jgi:hypothetical protein